MRALPAGWNIVRLHRDRGADRIADIPLPDEYRLRVLDSDDDDEIERWLVVYNAAYGRAWTAADWQAGMVENPYIEVLETLMVDHDGLSVATASIGRWRGRPDIGADHNLAVHPEHQGRGVASSLVVSRVRRLTDMGFSRLEVQTHLHRVGSLRAHFRGGFEPLCRRDPWHSPDVVPAPVRAYVHGRLRRHYRRWQASHPDR